MVSLDWCKKRRKGIIKAHPSRDTSEEYLKAAEETLRVLKAVMPTGSVIWISTVQYYFLYFLAYSILARAGVKSEIHDCTIQLFSYLETNHLTNLRISSRLRTAKESRIRNQYYLGQRPISVDMVKNYQLISEAREELNRMTDGRISSIRDSIFTISRRRRLSRGWS